MSVPKEYYLQYADKTPEQDILADTISVPFQSVKVFPENAKLKEDEWHNMLIFGDNLQALKHLLKLKKEGKLKNPDGSDGVKLCYIDPPFATEQEFKGSQDQKAYFDKLYGSKFIEFIRKRLIILREVLCNDGVLFIHMDQKMHGYIKVICDEVFGKNCFENEIAYRTDVSRGRKKDSKWFGNNLNTLYIYSKTPSLSASNYKPVTFLKEIANPDENFRKDKYGYFSDSDAGTYSEYSLYQLHKENRLFLNSKTEITIDDKNKRIIIKNGKPRVKYYLKFENGVYYKESTLDNIWDDLLGLANQTGENLGYPTQKIEKLIARIIGCSSSEGEIVMDCFAGSGTLGAVAEKLKRKWIMCDVGKLSIYTIQKRMLNLNEEIGNKGKPLKPKPFILYNAGLYDYNLIEKMGADDYNKFCLELFQCVQEKQDVNGFEMQGIRDNAPVHIFKGKFLTHDFIKSLDETVGKYIKKKMFIIAPDASVKFFEDWFEVNGNKYYILRIPYSIIDEIEKQEFTSLKQPDSKALLNDIVESVGFDFIEPPEVDAEYSIAKPKNKLVEFAQIKIKKFKSNQRSKKEKKIPDEDALSMVLIDSDYDGENFKLTDKFFKDEIEDNLIQFDTKIGKKVAIIYIDLYGNEKFEVIDANQFKKK